MKARNEILDLKRQMAREADWGIMTGDFNEMTPLMNRRAIRSWKGCPSFKTHNMGRNDKAGAFNGRRKVKWGKCIMLDRSGSDHNAIKLRASLSFARRTK